MISALLFDLDGVLWSSNWLHQDAFVHTCTRFGICNINYEDFAGRSTQEVFAELLSKSNREPELLETVVKTKQEYFLSRALEIKDNLNEISELKKRLPNMKVGLVTGASLSSASIFLHRAPDHFFDVIISASDGLPSKPDPMPYIKSCELLGVRPSNAIAFEDSLAGMSSARNAGLKVVHIHDEVTGGFDCSSFNPLACATTTAGAIKMLFC